MRRDVFFLIWIGVFILPSIYFTLFGGPFGERIIFDFINDEYFYKGDKMIDGEYLNVFWSKDGIKKVKQNILSYKRPFVAPEQDPNTGMVFLNFPEALVVLKPITPKLKQKMRLPLANTLIYVSSPIVGQRIFNRHGHHYVVVHRHYRSRYYGRYGRYFRSHGSSWGK